jgi:hypothetical protein
LRQSLPLPLLVPRKLARGDARRSSETGAGACVTAGSGPRCLKSFTYSAANGTASNGQSDRSKGKLTAASRYKLHRHPVHATVEVKETYQYDGSGNVWKTGSGLYLYDSLSRVVSGKVYPEAMGTGTPSTQTYGYDNYGNLTSTTTNGTLVNTPAATATNRLTAGTYDASGN